MNKPILYTTHCPKCSVLEKKLNNANIDYEICEDETIMEQKGLTLVPVLEIDNILMSFAEAVSWINNTIKE